MAKDIVTLRKHKESMGIYTSRVKRAAQIEALMHEHGPSGCKQLAAKLGCCRATVYQVIQPRIGSMFKLVRQATDGPYGLEALYDVKESAIPEVHPEAPVTPETQNMLHQIMYGFCRQPSIVGD